MVARRLVTSKSTNKGSEAVAAGIARMAMLGTPPVIWRFPAGTAWQGFDESFTATLGALRSRTGGFLD